MTAFKVGVPIKDAAAVARVDVVTLQRWIASGRKADDLALLEGEEALDEAQKAFRQVYLESRAGEAAMVQAALDCVQGAFRPQRQAVYKPNSKGEIDVSKPVKVTVIPPDPRVAADWLKSIRPEKYGKRVLENRLTDHEGKGPPVFKLDDLTDLDDDGLLEAKEKVLAVRRAKAEMLDAAEPAEG